MCMLTSNGNNVIPVRATDTVSDMKAKTIDANTSLAAWRSGSKAIHGDTLTAPPFLGGLEDHAQRGLDVLREKRKAVSRNATKRGHLRQHNRDTTRP